MTLFSAETHADISSYRLRLTISAAALLAACGGSQPPIGAPGAMPDRVQGLRLGQAFG